MANRVSGMKLNIFSLFAPHPHSIPQPHFSLFHVVVVGQWKFPFRSFIAIFQLAGVCVSVCVFFRLCTRCAILIEIQLFGIIYSVFSTCLAQPMLYRPHFCVCLMFFSLSNATLRTPLAVREFIFFGFIFSFMQIYCLLALCTYCVHLLASTETESNWHIRSDLPKCLFRLDKGIFIFFFARAEQNKIYIKESQMATRERLHI